MKLFRNSLIAAALVLFTALAGTLGPLQRAIAQAPGMQFITSMTGTEIFGLSYPCTVSCGVNATTLWGYGRAASLLYSTVATAGTSTGTGEQTLGSYSLPANTLNVGTKLIIRASFSAAANGNTKTFKCYFGASVISSGALTTNNKNGDCLLVVTKVGSSQQIVWGSMQVDVTPVTDYVNTTGTDTDTSAITVKFTGTDGTSSAADIVLNDLSVERLGR